MYSLIESIEIYSKKSGSLWQYYRDEPAVDNSGCLVNFPANNNNINSISFKFKEKITKEIDSNDIKKCCNNGTIKTSK